MIYNPNNTKEVKKDDSSDLLDIYQKNKNFNNYKPNNMALKNIPTSYGFSKPNPKPKMAYDKTSIPQNEITKMKKYYCSLLKTKQKVIGNDSTFTNFNITNKKSNIASKVEQMNLTEYNDIKIFTSTFLPSHIKNNNELMKK